MNHEAKHASQLSEEIVEAVLNSVPDAIFVSEDAPLAQVFLQETAIGPRDELSRRQRRLLSDLTLLHHSLRSPENLLDRGAYSRPFPPRPRGTHRQE